METRQARIAAFHAEIGKILNEMRRKRGKTQADYAVPQRTIRRIEKGLMQRSSALSLFYEMKPCSREAAKWMRAVLRLLAPGCLRCDPDCGMCDKSMSDLASELRRHTGLEEFAMERSMLKNIVELNPYAIVIFDEEGRFVRANQAYLRLFKQPPPKGITLFDSPPLKKAGVQEEFLRLKEGHVIELAPIWHNSRAAGEEWPDNPICIGTVAFPLRDRDGRIRHYVIMAEDVTQQVLAEERLQDALRFKTDFMATVSRELGAPLGAITANARALLNEKSAVPPTGQTKRLEQILENTERLMQALNDLVEMQRVYDNTAQVTAEYFFLQDVLRTSIASFNTAASEHTPRLTLDIAEDMPIVYNDRQKISHIIANLLGNALQATGGGEIRISARMSEDRSDRVRIAIHDGCGAESRNASMGARGHLDLVHTYTGLLGGDVCVEGGADGTAVTVTLPRALPFHA
jgi:signal transduction histidine kinase